MKLTMYQRGGSYKTYNLHQIDFFKTRMEQTSRTESIRLTL